MPKKQKQTQSVRTKIVGIFIYFLKAGVLFEVLSGLYFLFIFLSNKAGVFIEVAGIIWAIIYGLSLPVLFILSLLGAKFISFAKLETEKWGIATLFIINIPLAFIFILIFFPGSLKV